MCYFILAVTFFSELSTMYSGTKAKVPTYFDLGASKGLSHEDNPCPHMDLIEGLPLQDPPYYHRAALSVHEIYTYLFQ